jgi:hypothetical protein
MPASSEPNGKPAKLTLGPVDVSGVEPATAPSLESKTYRRQTAV